MRCLNLFFLACIVISLSTFLPAQVIQYEGPDDGAGDPAALREGCMNGNRVILQFQNTTELAMHPAVPNYSSWWPRGDQGHTVLNGVAMILTTRVYIHKQSRQPVDQPEEIDRLGSQGLLDTLFFCQTHFRIGMDLDPVSGFRWGFYPVWGYFNPTSETPAMSNNPDSWPPGGWPGMHGFHPPYPGSGWWSRKGYGAVADLEALLVANDAQDQEYVRDEAPVKYFPRGDKKIGSDIAVNAGKPWGGLGLRVLMRLYQWDNPEVRDVIFFEYSIVNISNYDYPEMGFGYLIDHFNFDVAYFYELAGFSNQEIDLAFQWATNFPGGYSRPTTGFAFLATPGLSNDNQDNDQDGLTDEKRDNQPVRLVSPDGDITNLDWFLSYYGKKQEELREHWDADEDQDWDDGIDADGNGDYLGPDDYAGDDIGLDGVGPGDLNYTGPDEGECDHKPSYIAGIGCEPDFNYTDLSEADMIGLTSYNIFNHPAPPYEQAPLFFNDDRGVFGMISSNTFDQPFFEPADILFLAGSFPFPLYKGYEQHVATAELHSYEDIDLITAPDYALPNLFRLKKMAQLVYDRDFRFAQPPRRPTLTATPGDGYVLLTWDDRSEMYTREPLLNNVNDFEGYKIYRSTNIDFSDTVVEGIVDGFNPLGRKAIFLCDLNDGIKGFTSWTIYDGTVAFLGYDSGITHSFRDNHVQNGRTYYYALVAYDYGVPPEKMNALTGTVFEEDHGIAPAENNSAILYDASGTITHLPENCAVVVPGPRAAGKKLIDTDIEPQFNSAMGTGEIAVEISEADLIRTGGNYYIKFEIFPITDYHFYDKAYGYSCNGISIYRIDDSTTHSLVYQDIAKEQDYEFIPQHYNTLLQLSDEIGYDFYHLPDSAMGTTDIFDGLCLKIRCPLVAFLDEEHSGWMNQEDKAINLRYGNNFAGYSFDYHLVFTRDLQPPPGKLAGISTLRDAAGKRIEPFELLQLPLPFYVENQTVRDPETGDLLRMEILVHDLNGSGAYEADQDRVLVGAVHTDTRRWTNTLFDFDFIGLENQELPSAGDAYLFTFQRPFFYTDSVSFTVNAREVTDGQLIEQTMDDIRVVPNPYLVWNAMETAANNRRLMFTHLPEKCTIKIFTVSGVLVRTLHVPEDGLVSYSGVAKSGGGIIHWDLCNQSGRTVAAGLYFYHVKDLVTGKEKLGKFAVIK